MHGARYGEVILASMSWLRFKATVYNTIGLNDCPEDLWKELDPRQIKKEHKALAVILNGPRYFLMDSVEVQSAVGEEPVTFGRLPMRRLAAVRLSIFDILKGLRRVPYAERKIERTTIYTFKHGREVYELVAADGATYVMQSYSLQVDASQNEESLKSLGSRLRLPQGWQFRVRRLDQDWVLRVEGVAHVVQDELQNTYQRAV
jgi:hypothetical protein